MTRIVVHTAISAALALVGFYSSPSLAADGDNSGKQIKRFEFVAPKAPVAQLVPPKAQFVAPKAGRTGGLSSGGGSPTTVFRLTPKAPPVDSASALAPPRLSSLRPRLRKTGLVAARSRPNLSRRKPRRPKPR